MNTDDVRIGLRQMKNAFMEFHSFRNNAARDIEWTDSFNVAGQFWEGFHTVMGLLNEYDAESDEINNAVYEDALAQGVPWAVEACEFRQKEIDS